MSEIITAKKPLFLVLKIIEKRIKLEIIITTRDSDTNAKKRLRRTAIKTILVTDIMRVAAKHKVVDKNGTSIALPMLNLPAPKTGSRLGSKIA
jgi:hypothetical protein